MWQGYIDLSTAKSGFSGKHRETSISALSKNRIFVNNSGLQGYDSPPSIEEGNFKNRVVSVNLFFKNQVSVREITQLIGKLSYSEVAVLPAPMHYRSLQRHQILKFLIKKKT